MVVTSDVQAVVPDHADAYVHTAVLIVVLEPAQAHVKVHVWDLVKDIVVDIAGINLTKQTGRSWQNGTAKNVTFIVTKDCQLACKYCYLIGKNEKERMTWEVAQKAIDYILANDQSFTEKSVIWDFIGGEPFLEIDLIDKICDYIKQEMYRLNHHWFNSYRFSFSTNGINYDSPKVQQFIDKNRQHLSIGITIDGTKKKHDLNRIWKGESEKGSYEDVVRNIPLWLKQFPDGATKVTISSADIPYIKESVLHLYSLGIHEININVVFEDVWREGDDKIFEEQLISLADSIIDNQYYNNFACSFFADFIGKPLDSEKENQNWCGAGKMLAVDAAGNFYPCTRFAAYSLRDKKPIIIGNVRDGIDQNKLRPFLTLDRTTQSPQKCIDCEIASGCAWCQGENYDAADTDTIYQRSTAICKMHKARVRANNYYWNKLFRKLELEGKREEFEMNRPKHQSPIC
ncbi:MAG: radical SAM peptide maturase, CXXX-repeat target family [Muribaculaceae bacterium]|nr:radical SAM peptide maturase, CXXX-repeat target family [Muribaculaceae bacterium]